MMSTSKTVSSTTEKYFIQKFTKEIINLFATLDLDDTSASNETLNADFLNEFLCKLGFITS